MEPDDVTLSDVHLDVCRPNTASQPDTNKNGYIVCKSRFAFSLPLPLCCRENEDPGDEDQRVIRRRSVCQREVIYLTHSLETKLRDVGMQVWPGCLLLCDFLLSHPLTEQTVLELGAGVGLASIIAAVQAKTVIATDLADGILSLCEQNLQSHEYMYRHSTPYLVRHLDFFHDELKAKDTSQYGWSESDKNLLKQVDTIVAADCIYDVDITDAMFRTLERLVETTNVNSIIIALEQRLNFTLSELDVTCPAYNHFLTHLQRLAANTSSPPSDVSPVITPSPSPSPDPDTTSPATSTLYHVEQLETESIPQHFHGYSRSKYLELWKIAITRDNPLATDTDVIKE